jgi:phosphatidylserine/phosphatidylglycerophosphate/cardiolipin synthase-like enzyme
VPGVPTRDTRAVVDELIRGAERSLWISSFVYFDGPRAFATLAARMEQAPALQVRLLLNVERPYGNTSAADALVASFAHRFWTKDWPGTRRPEVYYAPNALEPGENRGVLHAKVIIADEYALLITSANLTEAALDRNVEAGLLVRDQVLALSCARQLAGLIEHGHLTRLPDIITN